MLLRHPNGDLEQATEVWQSIRALVATELITADEITERFHINQWQYRVVVESSVPGVKLS